MVTSAERERWLRYWDRTALTLDASMRFMDRVRFRDSRRWVCSQAGGDVLEVGVGVGTGLRPGGVLLLADHVAAAAAPIRGLQRLAAGKPVGAPAGEDGSS